MIKVGLLQGCISNAARNDFLLGQTRCIMFKAIGACVVYGFAIYGFAEWVKDHYQDEPQK